MARRVTPAFALGIPLVRGVLKRAGIDKVLENGAQRQISMPAVVLDHHRARAAVPARPRLRGEPWAGDGGRLDGIRRPS